MGVDYYNCTACNEIFGDCSPKCLHCCKCDERFCGECHGTILFNVCACKEGECTCDTIIKELDCGYHHPDNQHNICDDCLEEPEEIDPFAVGDRELLHVLATRCNYKSTEEAREDVKRQKMTPPPPPPLEEESQTTKKMEDGDCMFELLAAVSFAAVKHANQKRKCIKHPPYIVHPLRVCAILGSIGRIKDLELLQAALLHDTVEDTETTPEEIEENFGAEVRKLVMQVTDDKSLTWEERQRLQVVNAALIDPRAQCIKLADKIANVEDLVKYNNGAGIPVGWTVERIQNTCLHAKKVVEALKECNPEMYAYFDSLITNKTFEFTDGTKHSCLREVDC